MEEAISPEEAISLEEIKTTLENEDLASALDKIMDYFAQQDSVELNIAVTGESGSGKSTFINAFRGIGDEEEGSAATGVTETTKIPTAYPHPKHPNVILWDLPGIGTPKFKADEYLKQVEFERYDFFIIIAADRFRECHANLAAEILEMNKTFYFVRSKIDSNIFSEKKAKKVKFNEEVMLECIQENCIQGLIEAGVGSPVVFLISSFDLGLYDFNRLQETMEKELPDHKKHVLLLALPNITMEINEKKKKALEREILKMSLLSACFASIPIPIVNAALSASADVSIVIRAIKKFHKAFSLDSEALQRLADRSGKSVEELKSAIKSPLNKEIMMKGIRELSSQDWYNLAMMLLAGASLLALDTAAEFWLGFIPVLGSVLSGALSFAAVERTLKRCLDELAEDAHNVLMAALQTSV